MGDRTVERLVRHASANALTPLTGAAGALFYRRVI
jgi:hypothetical protein